MLLLERLSDRLGRLCLRPCRGDHPLRLGGELRARAIRLSTRNVDGRVALRFRREHCRCLLALGSVDLRLAVPLGLEDDRALLALGLSLGLHRLHNALRRVDVLHFVPCAHYAPLLTGLSKYGDDMTVQLLSILEGLIERHLSDAAAHCRLREDEHRHHRVLDCVVRLVSVNYAKVDHSVDGEVHIVLGDRRRTLHLVRALAKLVRPH
mmetsp:Transcript_9142/g.18573  ORF Transcript_9142/g.18573 Transcript_9142/m.18573 type:complete len:208 (+) Transcript_9142:327-950(+)